MIKPDMYLEGKRYIFPQPVRYLHEGEGGNIVLERGRPWGKG